MKKPARFVCGLFLLMAPLALAQDAGGKQKLAAETKAEKKTDAPTEPAAAIATIFPYRPPDAWVGQRFIFLPGPKASEGNVYDDFYSKITRKQYAGRVAKVVSVEDFSGRAHLEFEMEDTKER
ncbi:MAG: hypothetical protein ABI977_13195, partial [Acidobacteriota bacterium]